uniref:ABC transporter substrate-binding protein n=1 Tax=Candidatus Egerieimonas intestinavium TaxID=2840777 RepID=A0A9D1ELP7_9FIRM|nr:ABC transporter substrate-binding protein [Candidatus Egerieimonas intestinavium]
MNSKGAKSLSVLAAAGMALVLGACGAEREPESKAPETVTVLDAYNEEVTVRVNPKRVAILEPSALDILDAAGIERTGIEQLGVQQTESVLPDYLSEYYSDDYINVGSLFEADYDTLDLLDPELIIYGNRFGAWDENAGESVDNLKERYPHADLLFYQVEGDTFAEDVRRNCETLGAIFPGAQEEITTQLREVEEGFAQVKEAVEGHETLFLMIGGGYITFYGPEGRFAMVHKDLGFTPADTNTEVTSHHGAEVNAEYVMTENPQVILLLNHDESIGEGATSSATEDFLSNTMIQHTDAYKNGDIYQLNPASWYINPGGLQSCRQMVADVMPYVEKLQQAGN